MHSEFTLSGDCGWGRPRIPRGRVNSVCISHGRGHHLTQSTSALSGLRSRGDPRGGCRHLPDRGALYRLQCSHRAGPNHQPSVELRQAEPACGRARASRRFEGWTGASRAAQPDAAPRDRGGRGPSTLGAGPRGRLAGSGGPRPRYPTLCRALRARAERRPSRTARCFASGRHAAACRDCISC